MDSIKWNVKLGYCILKNLTIFTNRRKVGRVQLSSNFFLLLSLITHSRARFEHVFFKMYIKSGNITEKKNKTLTIFLNIRMSANSNKIEVSEEFMVMWREEKTLLDVMSPSY